ncbi:hypothetical protein [Bradyrhizobium sp. Ash2021]|uniref:hypothetical protein n=1 Tax=Bradyrhizobium sp. Ash2021 TaxID=2954771 RepID=UPI0028168500|nr:hypothetical protein [Bradyrhizobium sp. Ash2021]WMT76948.1 hypothetical protein NL528_11595 [Bradyrhizobium sp. Ash2021]
MLTATLTLEDVQEFLKRLTATIELDQLNVDAMPPEHFATAYNDSMWRTWRHDHRAYIEKLLLTTDAMPPVMLWQLTGIAIAYEPARVGNIVLELFAEVVSGSCAEDLGTADRFFGRLIQEMSGQRKGNSCHGSAQASILRWLPELDPLRIARDPECGYGPLRVR